MIVALAPAWAHVVLRGLRSASFSSGCSSDVILRGIETIRFLQGVSAPFLLLIGLATFGLGALQSGRLRPDARHAVENFRPLANFSASSFLP